MLSCTCVTVVTVQKRKKKTKSLITHDGGMKNCKEQRREGIGRLAGRVARALVDTKESLLRLGSLALALVWPQLTTALGFTTQTLDCFRINLLGSCVLLALVIIEGQFGARGDIAVSEKGKVVKIFVGVIRGANRDDLAVRVARVVHKASCGTKLAAINDFHILFFVVVILDIPVQGEEVGLRVRTIGEVLSLIGFSFRDDLTEVKIDELSTVNQVGGPKT